MRRVDRSASWSLLVALCLWFIVRAPCADADDAAPTPGLASESDPAKLGATIRALGVVDDPKAVDALLDLVARPEDLVRATAMIALLKMTKPECGERVVAYGLAHKDGVVRAYAARACGKLQLGFVVDTSASMNDVFIADAAAAKSLAGTYESATKLAICKKEIELALASLDPRSFFSVIALGVNPRFFAEKAVRPSAQNVDSAIEWLRPLAGDGQADWVDGLRACLRWDESSPDFPAYYDELDSITLLTDGMSSTAQSLDTDAVVERYMAHWRYARVRTNVIVFGTTGGELSALRAIAEKSGGRFVRLQSR